MRRARPGNIAFLAVFALGLGADLATKSAAFRLLPRTFQSKAIWPPFLYLKHQENTGGVWGILSQQNTVFLVLSLAAIAAILLYLVPSARRGAQLPLPLAGILAGAIGNLWDRVHFGFVRDFLSVRVTESFSWPTFNVADALICVGCAVMALGLLRAPERAAVSPAGSAPAPPPPPASPPPG